MFKKKKRQFLQIQTELYFTLVQLNANQKTHLIQSKGTFNTFSMCHVNQPLLDQCNSGTKNILA